MEYRQLESLCLKSYYILRNIVGDDYPEMRNLFERLAEIYCIDKEKIDDLFQLSESDEISSIRCYSDYLIAMRAIDYRNRFGTPIKLSDDILFALSCKKSLRLIRDFSTDCGNHPTASGLLASLAKKSLSDNVAVAFIAAFLFYEGRILSKNQKKAENYAEKSANWNNPDGLLLLMHYGNGSQREACLSAFYTLAKRADMLEEYAPVFARYNWTAKTTSPTALLLADYLDKNSQESEIYNATISDLARCSFISVTDRKKILESGDRTAIGYISDLIIKDTCDFDMTGRLRDFVSDERASEANQIEVSIRKQASRVNPPLLVCRNDIALRYYVTALNKFAKDNVVYISGPTCISGCFDPKKGNEIIKNIISRGSDRLLFVIEGISEMRQADLEQLSILLSPANRGNYLLYDIQVSVNLNNCKFLLLSDNENIPECLSDVCQVITVTPANDKEIEAYVESVVDETKKRYECPLLDFSKESRLHLSQYDVAQISTIVSKICLRHSYEMEPCVIVKDDIEKNKPFGIRAIGF